MILGGKGISGALKSGRWTIEGGPLHINPNSIDVTLSNRILIPDTNRTADVYDPESVKYADLELIGAESFTIYPGEFLLGCTNERVDCSKSIFNKYFAPMYEGRSTFGRLGIGTHVTAGFGDYGFQGAFTLEIFNVSKQPVKLYPNIRIGQLYFMEVLKPIRYKGSYNGEDHYNKPIPPALGKEKML